MKFGTSLLIFNVLVQFNEVNGKKLLFLIILEEKLDSHFFTFKNFNENSLKSAEFIGNTISPNQIKQIFLISFEYCGISFINSYTIKNNKIKSFQNFHFRYIP